MPNANLEATLTRAGELIADLEKEYNACLAAKQVSPRAAQLTHEVIERLRSALDRAARCYWEQRISPALTEDDRKKVAVYFPIVGSPEAFDSTMGRWRWTSVKDQHQGIADFLKKHQPYTAPTNKWLETLTELATAGKHVDLVPQTITVHRQVTVASGGGSVSWGPGVTFGGGVSVMGAPINPRTQRIVPTPGVTETVTDWVSFMIGGHNVNALGFCTESLPKTRKIIAAMFKEFTLS